MLLADAMESNDAVITAKELHARLEQGRAPLLVDVLTEAAFAEAHLPGAKRATVYEVSFLQQMAALGATPSDPIIVYGRNARSLASSIAAEKLREAGYTSVEDFRGGLEEWKESGFPVEGAGEKPRPPITGVFTVDVNRSVIRWTGRNLLNHHEGTIRFAGGTITIEQDRLAGAEFTADLRTLACSDLPSDLAGRLIQHLMHADFFDVAKWQEARFTARSAMAIAGAPPGSPNYELVGDLSLRGQTHPIAFAAVIGASDEKTIGGQAQLDLDRTRWGALYGSGKFFDHLGQHLVNDFVSIHVKIVATRG